ncbi:MAG TPA: hypothetical protein VMI92_03190 [Steroidobacteraceae bacterium]|nr:hypothetical protein [Steroidobacteraceae bacterium]
MGLRKDIWRPAIIGAPLASILARGSVADLPLVWLPDMGSFRFMADPFGIWRDGRLHVFVETYDYRVRIGRIEVLVYDANLTLLERLPALAEPWHLSYPFVFEAEGETWMLPEAHKSRSLTLYRATAFPARWERAHRLALDHVPIDATPMFHAGRWWLFYTVAVREIDKTAALHLAWAERLAGPWHPLAQNPVRFDVASCRPGGTPAVLEGRVMLPVQDCTRTYGGAIRPLWFDLLTPQQVVAAPGPPLPIPAALAPFTEGLHTLSAAGAVTLIDAKRTELSLHGLGVEIRHGIAKARRRLRHRR